MSKASGKSRKMSTEKSFGFHNVEVTYDFDKSNFRCSDRFQSLSGEETVRNGRIEIEENGSG